MNLALSDEQEFLRDAAKGALAGVPGRYEAVGPLDSIQVPATVQAILAARIDRLRPELKRLLPAAKAVPKELLPILEASGGRVGLIADVQPADLAAGGGVDGGPPQLRHAGPGRPRVTRPRPGGRAHRAPPADGRRGRAGGTA